MGIQAIIDPIIATLASAGSAIGSGVGALGADLGLTGAADAAGVAGAAGAADAAGAAAASTAPFTLTAGADATALGATSAGALTADAGVLGATGLSAIEAAAPLSDTAAGLASAGGTLGTTAADAGAAGAAGAASAGAAGGGAAAGSALSAAAPTALSAATPAAGDFLALAPGASTTAATGATGAATGAAGAAGAAGTAAADAAPFTLTAGEGATALGATSAAPSGLSGLAGSAGSFLVHNPGLALSGAGLLGSFLEGNKKPAGYDTLAAQASKLNQQGSQMEGYLNNGTLPPGVSAGLKSAHDSAIATIKSQYASRGQTGSSAESQDLANLAGTVAAQGAQIATNLYQSGVSEEEYSSNIYQSLMQTSMQQDQALSDSIAKFSGSLAGSFRNNATTG